jgi:uncharacterized protein
MTLVMKHIFSIATILAGSLLVLASPIAAQDLAKGRAAYEDGDFAAALREWKPLAYEGNPEAQTSIGFMFYKGQGVPRNFLTAVNWYKLAAQQGYAAGQARLGFMYDFGRGVKKNQKTAVNWYKRAAEQGDPFGQLSLEKMYAQGDGILRNDSLAYMWSELAATNGSEIGARNRDSVGRKLTPTEKTKAQRLAHECITRNYKNCGR